MTWKDQNAHRGLGVGAARTACRFSPGIQCISQGVGSPRPSDINELGYVVQKNCKGTRDTRWKLIEKRCWAVAFLPLKGLDWGLPAGIRPMHPGNAADANLSTEADKSDHSAAPAVWPSRRK